MKPKKPKFFKFIEDKWVILIVILIAAFDYFSVVVAVGVGLVNHKRSGGMGLGIALITIFNLLFILFCLSYTAIVVIDPGYITQSYIPRFIPSSQSNEFQRQKSNESVANEKLNNFPQTHRLQDSKFEPTFCHECNVWRPPRAHHCRRSNKCVIDFDHYCPWIGQSVGGNNHKHFITFLFYCTLILAFTTISLGASYNAITSTETGNGLWSGKGKGPIIAAIAISAFFTIFVGALFGNHIWLSCDNLTTFDHIFEIRTTRARDQSVLSQHYKPLQLKERSKCRQHWYYEWGNPRTTGNLWWLDSKYRNLKYRMGSYPVYWFIPFAKPNRDRFVMEYNPRFDENGRARPRSQWPPHLQ